MKIFTAAAGAMFFAAPAMAHQAAEAHTHDSTMTIVAGLAVIALAVAAGAVRRLRAKAIA